MKTLLVNAFVFLVLLPLFIWQLSFEEGRRAPLAFASLLSAISAMWIFREEVTVRASLKMFAVAGFFFFIGLATTARIANEYQLVASELEYNRSLEREYEEPMKVEDIDPADLESVNAERESLWDTDPADISHENEEPLAIQSEVAAEPENEDAFDYFRGIPPAETESEDPFDSKY